MGLGRGWAWLAAAAGLAGAVPIDNGVVEDPTVVCGKDGIQMDFRTRNPFLGRIFVKGKAEVEDCAVVPPQYDETFAPDFFVSFERCGMSRLRMLNPRGMMYSVTVVLSFHPLFVTKVDRAYRVECFYGEVSREVSASFEVSQLPTSDITKSPGMPKCMYSVRRDSPDGLPIQFAEVGDKVFHRWECDSEMYGFLVKECFVFGAEGEDGGEGAPVEVVDARGCVTDPILVEPLTYDARIPLAFAQSHVFKFADLSRTHFRCNIQVCLRADGGCDPISPPVCDAAPDGPPQRLRRSLPRPPPPSDDELDLAQTFLVFDLDEGPNHTPDPLHSRPRHRPLDWAPLGREADCPASLGAVLGLLVLGSLCAGLSTALCLLLARRSSPDFSKAFAP